MESRRRIGGPTPVAVGIAWLLLASCGGSDGGGGDDSPSPPGAGPGEGPAAASSAAPLGRPAAGAAAQRPATPPPTGRRSGPQVLTPQPPRTRPEHGAVAATVDPGHPSDPWPSELLALNAETNLSGWVRSLYARNFTALRGAVTKDFGGRAQPDGQRLEGAELWALLADAIAIDGVTPAQALVEVEVVDVVAPPLGEAQAGPLSGRTRARVKIGAAPSGMDGDVATQVTLTLDVQWRLAKRARIASLDVLELSRLALPRAFRDVTEAVLGSGGGTPLPEILDLGAIEAYGRTDRLSPGSDVYLGMHGLAAGDLDGDGWDDLFVARAAGQPNLLFMNRRGRFVEEGGIRGLDVLDDTGGVLIADLDGDGARDVAFGRLGDVMIAWNEGDGRFATIEALPAARTDRVYSLAAADVDQDGDLDLYDTRYFASGGYGTQAPMPYHDATNGAPNVFWRNLLVDGEGPGAARRFRDDTTAIGLDDENDRFSLAATFDDLDGDGRLDLYVTNDFGRNSLYLGDGTRFQAAPGALGLVDKAAGMGVSVRDVDLDGNVDVVVSNMHSAAGMRVTREPGFGLELDAETRQEFMRHARGNSLFRGDGDGRFRDVTGAAGTGPGGWAWGARFVDWDRDGLSDIVVPNGFLSGRGGPDLQSFFWRRVVGSTPLSAEATGAPLDRYLLGWSVISYLSQFGRQHWNAHERTFSYHNRGDFRFEDVSLATGLAFADDGRALIATDYDQDGREDLIVRNRTSPILRVLQGVAPPGHWVSFRLACPGPNVDAIGARLQITAGGVERSRRVLAGDGFLGSASSELIFGLGDATEIEVVQVLWPDGVAETFDPDGGGEPLLGAAWTLRRGERRPEFRHRGHASVPGPKSELPTARPAAAPGAPREHVVLFDEFPLGAWRLPSFDGPAERIDRRGGELGTLVVIWSTAIPESLAVLSSLAAAESSLTSAGLRIHPLSLDGVRDESAAQRAAQAAGLAELGGRLDRSGRIVLEMTLARTIAPFDDLPLPLTLQFDAEGDLVALRVGTLGLGQAREDARRLADRQDSNDTSTLLGGRWADVPPKRDLGDTPEKLSSMGLGELGDHLRTR